jgi:hypothetical protein
MRNGWQHKRLGEIAKHSLGKMLDKAKNKGELKADSPRWPEANRPDFGASVQTNHAAWR